MVIEGKLPSRTTEKTVKKHYDLKANDHLLCFYFIIIVIIIILINGDQTFAFIRLYETVIYKYYQRRAD